MFRPLIFGGTTEGRLLAEYFVKMGIYCDVSVATAYGASLLPVGVQIHCGRLDSVQMSSLILKNKYSAVVDATHPYADKASVNIRKACETAHLPYYRLKREESVLWGETAKSIEELIGILNKCSDRVLCTLGSKALIELTRVNHYRERFWLRLLPSDGIIKYCRSLGYDENKIICQKGPFTAELNVEHIRHSSAGILITKESGKTGGYPEKAKAAIECGIRMITLARPIEEGFSLKDIQILFERKCRN
ncbi:MAG: precorrin-6A reductase [Ruminococcus sp.]|nr:precorrin-6A reductase [Ruminococcus sp.]